MATAHFVQKPELLSLHAQPPNIARHNLHYLRRHVMNCHHIVPAYVLNVQKLDLCRNL